MKIQQKSADTYQKEQLTDICRGCGEPRPGDDAGQSLPVVGGSGVRLTAHLHADGFVSLRLAG